MTAAQRSHQRQGLEHSNPAFEQLAEPFRRELKLHCYRMLGSLFEAEDAVQDTYLRAWRRFDTFEGRGSFRAWLYRIATNACLDAIASRGNARRFMPDERAPPSIGMPDGQSAVDVAWLEPYPDSDLEGIADDAPGPEARYASREAVQLAFVAVIQRLPPRQRAVLLLCDVLGWPAIEAATLLGRSTASINSALQRARDRFAKLHSHGRQTVTPAPSRAQQELVGRYVKAWEGRDLDGFVALLKEEATYTMPPLPHWYAGRPAIRTFFGRAWKAYGGFRLVPTAANRQPAFAAYSRPGTDGSWTAHSLHVLALEHELISTLTLFLKPAAPRLFQAFGLPLTLPD